MEGMHFKCQQCGECCKRYYVVTLPGEAAKQAELKGETERDFLKNHTRLFLHLFAREYSEGKIMVSNAMLPKRICDAIEAEHGFLPNFFIAVPALVFKREESGYCTFYRQGEGCTIYNARPLECKCFPFISIRPNTDYKKEYPFCHGLEYRDEKISYVDMSFLHFKQMRKYCDLLREKGFTSVWKAWPNKGVVLFENKLAGEIGEEEFLGSIAGLK
ncbi:MAG: YkgJ family cysteine cluster protein [archaeon]|nr:YkgJ family cysteine cluster protein [archaeon]